MSRRTALLSLLLVACGPSGAAPDEPAKPVDVRVADLAGLEAALAELRGQPVLLNFWATWCAPCVAELPDLLAAAGEHDGLRVLGVSFDLMLPKKQPDEVRALVRGFLQRRGFALPTVIYSAPDYEAINARFELPGAIPVTLAIDRAGKVVDREAGEGSRERFAEMARKALGS